ncbi:hypothetical protein B0H10DRAFT_760730 [Mycena sp. CBHHK59/15]|nr:hypothetical protein B0H10DRAFT_760730 [Mycena sp. CBHHK59/15]
MVPSVHLRRILFLSPTHLPSATSAAPAVLSLFFRLASSTLPVLVPGSPYAPTAKTRLLPIFPRGEVAISSNTGLSIPLVYPPSKFYAR